MKLFILVVIYLFQSIASFFSNQDVIYTIIAVLVVLYGLAHIFRLDKVKGFSWVVSPASSKQRAWYNSLGEKWYGILMGSIYTSFGILLLYLLWIV
ncbi:hypothetical protein [Maribacter forsetii]|uniref:hypothetical protein n=1 Tax=Maribacter forsetii TaxID=444515 RepID=UPI000563B160|nr:hypothetical protein [Maribacter forsetii]